MHSKCGPPTHKGPHGTHSGRSRTRRWKAPPMCLVRMHPHESLCLHTMQTKPTPRTNKGTHSGRSRRRRSSPMRRSSTCLPCPGGAPGARRARAGGCRWRTAACCCSEGRAAPDRQAHWQRRQRACPSASMCARLPSDPQSARKPRRRRGVPRPAAAPRGTVCPQGPQGVAHRWGTGYRANWGRCCCRTNMCLRRTGSCGGEARGAAAWARGRARGRASIRQRTEL